MIQVPLEQVEVGEEDTISDEDIVLELSRIKEAIQELPDGFRTVFSLYLLEGYDHREIADILGVSESTSKSQYNRAKKRLKEILKERIYING
jgi:RNA polymerase sigma-70 factor (ECF subfamily)